MDVGSYGSFTEEGIAFLTSYHFSKCHNIITGYKLPRLL